MRKQLGLAILTVLLTTCQQKDYQKLDGEWYWTLDPKYVSDTLQWGEDIETGNELLTISTDTGIVVAEYDGDTFVRTREFTKVSIANFHFDDLTHGVLSQYELDTAKSRGTEDPRYTATNINFWIIEGEDRNMIVFDYHFNQNGRVTDTLEFHILDGNLIIREDTLKRL